LSLLNHSIGSSKTNLNLEVPAEIREIAEKSVEQARKAFGDFVVAAQKATAQSEAATASLTIGAKEVFSKAMGYAEANVKAAFDFAQKLVQIHDPKEILAVQSEVVKTQLATVQEQAKELGEVAKKAGTPSVQ
jgi:phasin